MESPTVLIVDDNAEIAHGATLRLQAAGYSSLTASSGHEALRVAARELPDAILLDVLMPGMDGLETMRRLRRADSTRAIPVVMLSASLRDRQAALDGGARFFLTKPYAHDDLLAAVGIAMQKPPVPTES